MVIKSIRGMGEVPRIRVSRTVPPEPALSRILSNSCSKRATSFSRVAIRASFVSRIAVRVLLEGPLEFWVYAFSNCICSALRVSLVAFNSWIISKQNIHWIKRKFLEGLTQHYFLETTAREEVDLQNQKFERKPISPTGISKRAYKIIFVIKILLQLARFTWTLKTTLRTQVKIFRTEDVAGSGGCKADGGVCAMLSRGFKYSEGNKQSQ